jgi:hypothetical protein
MLCHGNGGVDIDRYFELIGNYSVKRHSSRSPNGKKRSTLSAVCCVDFISITLISRCSTTAIARKLVQTTRKATTAEIMRSSKET